MKTNVWINNPYTFGQPFNDAVENPTDVVKLLTKPYNIGDDININNKPLIMEIIHLSFEV